MQESFERLEEWKTCPSIVSYNSVMGILSRSGAMRAAFLVLGEMEGFSPKLRPRRSAYVEGSAASPDATSDEVRDELALLHLLEPSIFEAAPSEGESDDGGSDAATPKLAEEGPRPHRSVRRRPNASTYTLMVKVRARVGSGFLTFLRVLHCTCSSFKHRYLLYIFYICTGRGKFCLRRVASTAAEPRGAGGAAAGEGVCEASCRPDGIGDVRDWNECTPPGLPHRRALCERSWR